MTERLGIGGESAAAASPALAASSVRPRIGADRFRALAERLKKPGSPAEPLQAAAAVAPISVPSVPPAMGHIIIPDLAVPAAVAVPAVPVPPVPPLLPDVVVAPVVEVVAASPPLPVAPSIPAAPVPEPAVALSDVVAPPEPEPIVSYDAAAAVLDEPLIPAPEPPLAHGPPHQPEPVQAAAEPIVEIEAPVTAAPFVVPESLPEADIAPPVAVEVEETHHISPRERILAAEPKHVVPQVVLPEILPPPPPPPPPRVIEENGEKVTVTPPTMEVVQERLREVATSRLNQLDIENIWRQVLASPSLEERAEFLREAAEAMAAEQGADVAAVPPEHDLSRIASATSLPPEPEVPAPLVTSYAENEQLETAELARSLLDMMASGTNSGLPHERALAADTLLRLLPKLAAKPLAMLAQRLAMMDNPPQLLVAKLIRDERVEVSGPLLEDCMHITDQDLATVVAEEHPGKRRMVARRRKLSQAISDKLIATKEPSVLLTLVRNANADISHAGFNALIDEAAKHEDLMAPLSTRGDLGAPHAFELFWPAPPQLRRYLLHRFLTDSETLTKILRITLSAQAGNEGKDDVELPSAGDVMEYLEIACRGRIETAAMKLGDALNVDAGAIHRILLDREGEALIVMLKAAGFPRSSVGDLLPALKRGDVPLIKAERDVSELQSMFDTLSNNKARILLTYWNWAVRKSGPYAPLH